MRLVIVGASGLIGGHLFAAAAQAGRTVVGTFTNQPRAGLIAFDMRTMPLRQVLPDLGATDVVYVLSAYSNPSWIFDHQEAARDLNLDATRRLIDEVIAAGARVVFMSSVEVFDGANGDYQEDSAPRPLNLYGKLKHEIEKHLAAAGGRTTIVRTGWNIGWDVSHRCVVTLTYQTLLQPDARMADDNTFSVSDVKDTAAGLLRVADEENCAVIHLASRPHLVRTDLADLIIKASSRGGQMAYRPVPFSTIPYSEPRARCNHLNTSLATSRYCMSFRDAGDIVRDKVQLLDRGLAS